MRLDSLFLRRSLLSIFTKNLAAEDKARLRTLRLDQFAAGFAEWWREYVGVATLDERATAVALANYCLLDDLMPLPEDQVLGVLAHYGIERVAEGYRVALPATASDLRVRDGIFRALQDGREMTVSQLAGLLSVNKSAISRGRHGIAGLIERRRGRDVFLSLKGAAPKQAAA